MNICIVCPYFHSAKYAMKFRPDVFDVSGRLTKRGHTVMALTSKAYGAPAHEVINSVEVYRIPSLTLPNIYYYIPSFAHLLDQFLKICRDQSIDIVHFWDYEYLMSSSAVFLRRRLKNLPFVLTAIAFPGVNWHYGVKAVDLAGLAYTQTIGRLILKSVDHVIVLGKSLVKYALWMGVPKDRISINSFGIDLQSFRPKKDPNLIREEFKISSDDRVIVYVGRLAPVKGITYLLQAAKLLLHNMQNLKFLIVGDGPLRSELQKFEDNHIIFTGWRNDVVDLLNIAEIFVLPSLSEGLPVSLLEAYALAKPVIATNVGVVSDLVVDHKTGLLVVPRNPKQLEEAIFYLIMNPDVGHKMGFQGRKYVEEFHNWNNIIDKYEEIYGSFRHG